MTSLPHAFFTIDIGSATVAAALVARVDGRWRLLGAAAAPASVALDALLGELAARAKAAEPSFLPDAAAWSEWARVESHTAPPPRLVLVGPSERAAEPLLRAFTSDGWETTARVTAERSGALDAARALRDPDLDLVVVAAPEGLGGGERETLADLLALVGATAALRDGLAVLVAGPAAGPLPQLPSERVTRAHGAGDAAAIAREIVRGRADGRDAFVRAIASLAVLLDLRVEGVDVGLDASTRVLAGPDGVRRRLIRADAALVPRVALDDQAVLDRIMRWSPIADDVYAVRDRLRNLRLAPWRDAAGDGARLRLAAARAALAHLDAAWREEDREGRGGAGRSGRRRSDGMLATPDLLVASGGAFATAPGPAVALALTDTLRRPGAVAMALDHARLLAPLGTLDDENDRRRLLADLLDDLLLPLGSAIVVPGLRPARKGNLRVTVEGSTTTLPLAPSAVQVVDVPPGLAATAELDAPDDLFVGTRARRVAFEVAGGIGGLLVDTREIPLRLPERPERRREHLDAWQRPLWTNADP